jgi:hypothetical protein
MFRGTRPRGCGRVPGLSWARRSRPGPPGAHPPALGRRRVDPVHLARVPFWGWLGWVHYRIMWLRGRPSPTRGHARPGRDHRNLGATRLAVVPSSPTGRPGSLGRDQRNRDLSFIPAARVPAPADHGPARGPVPGWSRLDHPGEGLGVEGRDHSRLRGTHTGGGLVENGRAPQSGTAAHAPPGFGSAPNPASSARRRVEVNGREHRRGPDRGAGTGWPGPGTARPPAAARPDSTRSTRSRPTHSGRPTGGGHDPN